MNEFGEALMEAMTQRGIDTVPELAELLDEEHGGPLEEDTTEFLAALMTAKRWERPNPRLEFLPCLEHALGMEAAEFIERLLTPLLLSPEGAFE